MSLRSTASSAFEVVAIVVVASLVLGAVVGQPILLSYVETGSMEPTIDTGDGFIAVPAALAGDVDEGDVVVYEATELQGGGLTTHRVVAETDRGYVTKGDANPFTDQDGPEPPVSEDQIVAHALQIGGWVVVLPNLGVVIQSVQGAIIELQSTLSAVFGVQSTIGGQGAGLVLFTVGAVLFLLTLVIDDRRVKRSRERSRRRGSLIDTQTALILLLAAILVPANAAMIAGGGVQELTIDGEDVAANPEIEAGDEATWEIGIDNEGLVPLVLVFEGRSLGTTVVDERTTVSAGQAATVSVSTTAPGPGDQTAITVTEYRYLLVLPPSVIGTLHEGHPFVALSAVNVVLALGVLLVFDRVVGFGTVRVRQRNDVALKTRLRRRFSRE